VDHLLTGSVREHRKSPGRDVAPRFWLKNNLSLLCVFGFVLLVVAPKVGFQNHRHTFLYIYIVACVINSGIDLWWQREFYLPKLDELYREARQQADQFSAHDPRAAQLDRPQGWHGEIPVSGGNGAPPARIHSQLAGDQFPVK
jgi:hypothetical protein